MKNILLFSLALLPFPVVRVHAGAIAGSPAGAPRGAAGRAAPAPLIARVSRFLDMHPGMHGMPYSARMIAKLDLRKPEEQAKAAAVLEALERAGYDEAELSRVKQEEALRRAFLDAEAGYRAQASEDLSTALSPDAELGKRSAALARYGQMAPLLPLYLPSEETVLFQTQAGKAAGEIERLRAERGGAMESSALGLAAGLERAAAPAAAEAPVAVSDSRDGIGFLNPKLLHARALARHLRETDDGDVSDKILGRMRALSKGGNEAVLSALVEGLAGQLKATDDEYYAQSLLDALLEIASNAPADSSIRISAVDAIMAGVANVRDYDYDSSAADAVLDIAKTGGMKVREHAVEALARELERNEEGEDAAYFRGALMDVAALLPKESAGRLRAISALLRSSQIIDDYDEAYEALSGAKTIALEGDERARAHATALLKGLSETEVDEDQLEYISDALSELSEDEASSGPEQGSKKGTSDKSDKYFHFLMLGGLMGFGYVLLRYVLGW